MKTAAGRTTTRSTRTDATVKPRSKTSAAGASVARDKGKSKGASAGTDPGAGAKTPRVKKKVAAPTVLDPAEARRQKTRQIATWIAAAGLDKKAERIEIIDIGDKVDYADFLVLMSGRSDRQVQGIAGGIEESLRERGERVHGTEGMSQGHWVLLDYSDVIVHVFLEEVRKNYDLEGMWMEAKRVPFDANGRPSLPPEPVAATAVRSPAPSIDR